MNAFIQRCRIRWLKVDNIFHSSKSLCPTELLQNHNDVLEIKRMIPKPSNDLCLKNPKYILSFYSTIECIEIYPVVMYVKIEFLLGLSRVIDEFFMAFGDN